MQICLHRWRLELSPWLDNGSGPIQGVSEFISTFGFGISWTDKVVKSAKDDLQVHVLTSVPQLKPWFRQTSTPFQRCCLFFCYEPFSAVFPSAMYSQSNSFMGGGNSARVAPGQFGQPQQPFNTFQQPPQQQQQPGFVSQPTGYGATPIQSQFTGYQGPGQQLSFQAPPQQPQFTGYPPQGQLPQQPSFQQPPQQQPFQPVQAQQIQQPQPPPAAPVRPQQTSSQIAQSFQTASPASATPVQNNRQPGKIPNIRLSFITATDQAKFEQLFKSAVGDNKALDGKTFPTN